MTKLDTCTKCYRYLPVYAVHFGDHGKKFSFCQACAKGAEDNYEDMHSFLNNQSPVTEKILKARQDREKGLSEWMK